MKGIRLILLFLLALLAPSAASAYSQKYYQSSYYSQSYYQSYYQSSYYSGAGGAAHTDYRILTYTGSTQTFTVPTGVSSLRVVVVGGGGGGGGDSNGWGSGAGGGCGGGVSGTTVSVTPGQTISYYVGAGGAGGAGPTANGSSGQGSYFGSVSGAGGGWGRNGYYNLYGSYAGGSGGGSGGGGGGNGWPGFYALNAPGGKGGNLAPNNYSTAGGYCTGAAWSGTLTSYITAVSFSTGDGGYAPGGNSYWGGGGGGGLIINNSTVNATEGNQSPNNNGKGYGGGGGGANASGPAGGSGAPGVIYVEWTAPAASCSVSFAKNPIDYGASTTLTWSSSGATSVYIQNIGYVTTSGSTTVSPAETTNYACTASGLGGSDGTHNAVLTVNEPVAPTCSITVSPSTINQGDSATVTWSSTGATDLYIDYIGYVSTAGSTTVSPSATRTYAGAAAGDGGTADCTGTLTLTVRRSCTLDGETLEHGQSDTFYTSLTAPTGQLCSSVAQTRTCNDGTLSGSATYRYASCSCAPVYSCSGSAILYTNSSCSTSTTTTCVAPTFCSSGASTCTNPTPDFVDDGDYSGHLQARPQVVRPGRTTRIHWNVDNVESCTVTGSNGDSWTALDSGNPGKVSSAISERTSYTLDCDTYGDTAFSPETIYVNVVPVFQER